MTYPKSEADQQRQKLFEQLRHYFSSKHQVPTDLSFSDLKEFLIILGEYREAA